MCPTLPQLVRHGLLTHVEPPSLLIATAQPPAAYTKPGLWVQKRSVPLDRRLQILDSPTDCPTKRHEPPPVLRPVNAIVRFRRNPGIVAGGCQDHVLVHWRDDDIKDIGYP